MKNLAKCNYDNEGAESVSVPSLNVKVEKNGDCGAVSAVVYFTSFPLIYRLLNLTFFVRPVMELPSEVTPSK